MFKILRLIPWAVVAGVAYFTMSPSSAATSSGTSFSTLAALAPIGSILQNNAGGLIGLAIASIVGFVIKPHKVDWRPMLDYMAEPTFMIVAAIASLCTMCGVMHHNSCLNDQEMAKVGMEQVDVSKPIVRTVTLAWQKAKPSPAAVSIPVSSNMTCPDCKKQVHFTGVAINEPSK